MTLRMQQVYLDQLRKEGESSYPSEACGVLVGRSLAGGERTVERLVSCGNANLESPGKRYRLDPRDLVRVQREAREAGQAIVGFYHSHPDCPAHWSLRDLEEAHWTGCSYVIVGVNGGRSAAVNSFLLVGDAASKRLEEEPIELY